MVLVGYCQQCDFNIASATPTKFWIKSTWFTNVLGRVDSLGTTQETPLRADAMAMGLGERYMESKTLGIFRNLECTSHLSTA